MTCTTCFPEPFFILSNPRCLPCCGGRLSICSTGIQRPVEDIMTYRKSIKLLNGKIRRQVKVVIRSPRTKTYGLQRKGRCVQCGTCCKLLFRCPFLDNENRCSIYTSGLRPAVCAKFPICPKDLVDVQLVGDCECGYRFDAEEKPIARTETQRH